MISRTTAKQIATLFALSFRTYKSYSGSGAYESDAEEIYDFLFENDFPAYLCNAARTAAPGYRTTRHIEDFIMKLHTGESIAKATKGWAWRDRERLGEVHLKALAEDLVEHWRERERGYREAETVDPVISKLKASLELDGFVFRGKTLLAPEADILDALEQTGVLQALYSDLGLARPDIAFHHLSLSEEHYLAKRWDDSISNSRKFFETVLEESASAYSAKRDGHPLDAAVLGRPVKVRDYLERMNLIDKKEKEAVSAVYGLLSETGGHPYMARNDQARLLRHLALTLSQFVMLRLRGTVQQ
jgi:hypothetical protein